MSGIIEAYILFKNGFNISVKKYFYQQLKYYCIFGIGLFGASFICQYVTCNYWVNIFLKGVVALSVLMLTVYVFFGKTDEFQYVYSLVKTMILKRKVQEK